MTVKVEFYNVGGHSVVGLKPWLRQYRVTLMNGASIVKTAIVSEDALQHWIVKEI